ncbi:MAG: hypothetical protein CME70_10245 [Halobacteriovorax sp.]|nr:hypothetical protein [Halobacteriovorax sp.]|tara:strand:+ start:25846 stop:26307 length:462 start_codon:yes stop_codon:yes gene_type:complete
MKKLIVLSIILLPLTAFARKPAVEPVTGISIDDYKEVPPEQAKGFDWNNENKNLRVEANSKPAIKVDVTKLPEQEIMTVSTPDLTPAIILMMMLALPFGIWFFLLGKLDAPVNEKGFEEEEDYLDNTLAFPSKKIKSEKDDNDDDDFNIPKAS